MPKRLAKGANTCSDSLAKAAGTGSLVAAQCRRVCKREARRSMTTRKSRLKASSILRTFSVWRRGLSGVLSGPCVLDSAARESRCTCTSWLVCMAS